jgi:ABC-type glutathione transport system ATPase component
MAEAILTVSHLKKYYHVSRNTKDDHRIVKAVDDISFTMERGKTLAVVGESGSGKTTLTKMIMRFEPPTEGQIRFKDTDISGITRKGDLLSYRKSVQMVYQDPASSLNPRKTVREIIAEPLVVHKCGDHTEIAKRVRELIDVVALPADYIDRYPHTLSGGQKQRVGIARAIALNSELILLDEPTSALDVSVQSKIIDLLEDIQRQFGLSYFFITHDLALARNFADDAIVMQQGKVVEQGTVEGIFKNPRDGYTRRLLKSIPVVEPAERAYIDRIAI